MEKIKVTTTGEGLLSGDPWLPQRAQLQLLTRGEQLASHYGVRVR